LGEEFTGIVSGDSRDFAGGGGDVECAGIGVGMLGDDTTLGWVYQYWNDPEREALDAKMNGSRKVEPHEIASKTQMFTERYRVEWLLQDSLGRLIWLRQIFSWLRCRKMIWRWWG